MTHVHYNYTGCVTVVTGGANGIGADFVALMRSYGSRVLVRDLPRFQPPGAAAEDFVAVDVTDLSSVEQAMAQTLAPAAIETELLSQMSPQHVQTMIDKSPMKRLGTVREVSNHAAWLCSDACTFSTGHTFDLSGGRATY